MTLLDAVYHVVVAVATVFGGVLVVAAGLASVWAMAHPRRAGRVIAAILRHPDVSVRIKCGCVVSSVGAVAFMFLGIQDLVRSVIDGDRAAVRSGGSALAFGLALLGVWLIPLLELGTGRSIWRDGSKRGRPGRERPAAREKGPSSQAPLEPRP
jgi:hypothetical protein